MLAETEAGESSGVLESVEVLELFGVLELLEVVSSSGAVSSFGVLELAEAVSSSEADGLALELEAYWVGLVERGLAEPTGIAIRNVIVGGSKRTDASSRSTISSSSTGWSLLIYIGRSLHLRVGLDIERGVGICKHVNCSCFGLVT